jgi:hypothetical protein
MLKTKDMFLLSAIADKTGLSTELPAILKNKDQEQVGIQLVAFVISKLYKAQNEVIALIVSATGKTKDEVDNLGMKELVEVVKGILGEEGILDFFTNSVKE